MAIKTNLFIGLLTVLSLTSCIKQLSLYDENSSVKKELISEPFFFYSVNDKENSGIKAEFILTTSSPVDIKTVQANIPALKFNKSILFMLTQDDCHPSAFSNTWAIINRKPFSSNYYYDIAHLNYNDLPPDCVQLGKALGSTDGALNEIRFHFTTTLTPEENSMNAHTNIQKGFQKNNYRFSKKSTLVWGNIKEILNYGNSIAFHDVKFTKHTPEDIVEHFKIAQEKIAQKLNGRTCKILAEPNGDKTYINAALQYPFIKSLTNQSSGYILRPFQLQTDLKKETLERFVEEDIEKIKDKLKIARQSSPEERKATYICLHNTQDKKWTQFLLWLNDTYGKDGDDSVWFPSHEEFYEYNYYRIHSQIQIEPIGEKRIKLIVHLNGEDGFYFPSTTINLKGITKEMIQSIETNDAVTGLSYANHEEGMMLNIDCRQYLAEHAEHFVNKYETDKSNESNKADAIYFVHMLKESKKKTELLNRINQ